MRYARLWVGLAIVFILSFTVLGYYGGEIYHTMPPIPERVVTTDGNVLFTGNDIREGQNVWQSMGGQQVGTVWGHGAYVAPDWTADWLHRESLWFLNTWSAAQYHRPFASLGIESKASLQAKLQTEMRTNTYDPKTGDLIISPLRAQAFRTISQHFTSLFTNDPKLAQLRDDYALPDNTIADLSRVSPFNAFLWWATWSCATDRSGSTITYTNNWPHEPLIGNNLTGSMVVWSVVSFVLLLAGIGALAWYYAVQKHQENSEEFPDQDPLLALSPTPSMKATLKYFWVVAALFVLQIGLGAITAHFQVEGTSFYGIPIAKWIPYSVTRSWHTQLAIFWIATAWLATGLFMAPAVSGYEPKGQRFFVNFLFVCLILIVVGGLAGQWLAIMQHIHNLKVNFWFGHQGYEYTDIGRFWQIFLTVGLFLWFFLMARALWPAFRKAKENRHLLGLFLLASLAIPVFYVPCRD